MNSLSKIALFTLLSGAVFAAQAAEPHAGMVMHEQPAAAQAQSIPRQRRH
ncbi:copper-binding protein [Klebsiella pneumoniae]|uniref:Copper-binding protein n=1 Tax=Klebsiella pneumoniae TaxID=573 RepID=A0A4P0XL27_KLEPN|nr:copper-binding protein [Klebsiella pneumoniae]